MENETIKVFDDKRIRTAWNEQNEEWYFSIVDVVGTLTNQKTARSASNYWANSKNGLLLRVFNC